MNNKTKIRKTLERVRKERSRRFDFRTKQRLAEFSDYQKRQKQTTKTQDRLLHTALGKAGIDPQLLGRLHEKDNQAAESFRKRQFIRVQRYALQVAKQRRKSSKQMHAFLRKHFGTKMENPSLTVPIKTATDIDVTFSTVGNGSLSDVERSREVMDNSVRIILTAGSDSDWGIAGVIISYDFVWVADRSGIAEAVAWFLLDGTYSLWAEGKCIGDRAASVSVEASVAASQPISGSETGVFLQASQILDQSVRAECTSRSRSGTIDDDAFRLVSRTSIPIVADLPVILSASLQIYCTADEDARVEVDATTDSLFGLNVPSAFLVLDY